MNIEVEIRSFITKEKYEELLDFFTTNSKLINEENDITQYYKDHGEVRINRNENSAKIILKTGNIHDEQREESEIKIAHDDFEKMEKTFSKLGLPVQIKWVRKRHTFKWQGITVQLGDNKGYGYVIELEIITTPEGKDKALETLKEKLANLNIPLTPKEEFEKKYAYYKDNWKKLVA